MAGDVSKQPGWRIYEAFGPLRGRITREVEMALRVEGVCPLLQVFDMPASLRFYRDVLGFEIVQRSRPDDDCGWSWLKSGNAELMLNTAYDEGMRPPAPDAVRIASHEDMALYFGCPDVDAAYRHLQSHGLDVKPPNVAPYGMKQLYVKDPDGYSLCFQWAVAPESRG